MTPSQLNQALDQLSFADAEERKTFSREMEVLLEDPVYRRLVQIQNLSALQRIFWRVWMEQSPFQLALRPEAWLRAYFSAFHPLPEGEVALTTFLEITAMDLNPDLLEEALDKQYYFGSEGFRHLALGGSVRKGPDPRPYTRRMAKYFVTLPADFPHPEWDLYLYFFARNHGAEGMLLELLQDYLRHPEEIDALQRTMDTWTPVIQKLVAEDFNQLEVYDARQLLGYLYHILRDQPGYRIQGRSLAQLQAASQEYHRAIEERYRRREAERRAREQAYEQWLKEKRRSWDPHPRVKTYDEPQGQQHQYRIVELLTESALSQEGAVMRHCVGTYADLCKTQSHSVWSLREFKKSRWFSLVTIHLVNNIIAEVRGPFNAKPTREHREIIERWAEKEHLQWRGFS